MEEDNINGKKNGRREAVFFFRKEEKLLSHARRNRVRERYDT